jgi:hypothetical protein
MSKDDNDLLAEGALSLDPFEGTVEVQSLAHSSPPAALPESSEPLSIGVADFFATCNEHVEYVLEPFIIKSGFVLVMGPPKSGKTWFVAWLAAEVAARRVGRVHIVEEEGSREVLRDRLKPFLGSDPRVHNDMLRISFRRRVCLDQPGWVERLATDCQGAALIVLDPFIALHALDENDQSQIGRVLANIQDLISRTGAAVVLVHHTRKGASWNKSNAEASSSADARGSGALIGSVDSVIVVRSVPDEERCSGQVRFSVENSDTRVGEPFPRRVASVDVAGNSGNLVWMEDSPKPPEETDDLLDRVLLALPSNPEKPMSRQVLREVLHVNKGRLAAVINEGIEQRKIGEIPKRGLFLISHDTPPRAGAHHTPREPDEPD